MTDLSRVYLYRITHIENIPHVMREGITHARSVNRNPDFVTIGDDSLITSRDSFLMSNGKFLGDYIPFYFGPRMPMLYVIQFGRNKVPITPPANVVYCITTVGEILKHHLDFVFTNGHARSGFSSFYFPNDVGGIEKIVDYSAVNCKYWNDENDLDLKRRKEAEFLVLGDVPFGAVKGFIVYDEESHRRMINFGVAEKQLAVRPKYYF